MNLPGRLAVAALLSGARGRSLRIHGVRLGDSATQLANAPYAGRELGESPQEAHDRRGFELRCDEVSFALEAGLVSRIYLKPECFADVRWNTPEDVTAALGAADVVERGNRSSRLTFPGSSLVIFLDHTTGQVRATIMHVKQVGPRRYAVRDLLHELTRAPWLLGGETPDWPSAQARRKRAEILASEFGLDLRQLEKGDFLRDRTRSGQEFHAILRRHAGDDAGGFNCDEAHAFFHLWSFRRVATQLLRHNDGFLEASGEYIGLIRMTAVGDRLDRMLDDVDYALCLLLDPEQRTIDESALLRRGWVTDTLLSEMEADEW